MQPASTSQIIALSLLRQRGSSHTLSKSQHSIFGKETCSRGHCESIQLVQQNGPFPIQECFSGELFVLSQHADSGANQIITLDFQDKKLLLPPSVVCENVNLEGDSSVFTRSRAIRHGVLVLPGNSSFYDNRKTTFVRVSFSLLNEEETDEALSCLASALREEWEVYCPHDNDGYHCFSEQSQLVGFCYQNIHKHQSIIFQKIRIYNIKLQTWHGND